MSHERQIVWYTSNTLARLTSKTYLAGWYPLYQVRSSNHNDMRHAHTSQFFPFSSTTVRTGNSHSPDFGLNPMNSEQAQAKQKCQIPLLRHICRHWPTVGLGCKQSFMEGRHAAGMSPDRIPGHEFTLPRHRRWQCYGSTPFSKSILAQEYSV